MFGAVDEGAAAYGVLTHRHQPEIEQVLGQVGPFEPTVIFTPHLIPMQRGILSTCYVPVTEDGWRRRGCRSLLHRHTPRRRLSP